MSGYYERKNPPNLGFIDAKQSFKKDLRKSFFGDDEEEYKSQDEKLKDKEE